MDQRGGATVMVDSRAGEIRAGDERVGSGEKPPSGPEWRVDGVSMGELIAEVKKPRRLELTFRAGVSKKDNVLKPLDENAGKLQVVKNDDGSWQARDRSETGNTYYLTPPGERDPLAHPNKEGYYLVADYEQTVVDQKAEQFEVKVAFVPRERIVAAGVVLQNETAGEWYFETDWGDVSTPHVSQRTKAKSKKAVEMRTVEMLLTPVQAEALTQTFYGVAATRVVDVPDGNNYSVDNSRKNYCTIDVTSPNADTGFLPTGTYHVHRWVCEWVSDVRYRFKMNVMPQ